jgi:D-alanyl-D-alanine carboxypeptidase (penicillin-binding protein 5/6)
MSTLGARSRAFVVWCVLFCLIAGSAPGIGTVSASAAIAVVLPRITAKAVYAVDLTAGVELLSDRADDRRAPASTTKIAAAIVVVDNVKDLDQPVTIEEADVAPLASDESRLGVEPGDVLTVRQLLEGMLIQSGSDATYAAARVVGTQLRSGDKEREDPVAVFVDAMNGLVDNLKLKNTHFANPVGIDQKGHYSSARDLSRLAEEALARPTLAEIVAQRSLQMVIDGPNRREVTLENTNDLLDGGAIHGVKTGTTGDAGACLVLAKWEHGTNQVVTVVLGSEIVYDQDGAVAEDKRWDDTNAVLKAIEQEVRWVAPSDPEDVPGLREELAAWQVVLKDEGAIVVPAAGVASLRYLLQLGPAGKPNAQVGSVVFFVGDEKIAQLPVFQAPVS